MQMNWLEFASLLYDQDLVDFTIVGQAVGDEQRRCQTRERLALIDSPGTYQPVQSFALLDQVHSRPVKKDRAYWGLPADKFIILVPEQPTGWTLPIAVFIRSGKWGGRFPTASSSSLINRRQRGATFL